MNWPESLGKPPATWQQYLCFRNRSPERPTFNVSAGYAMVRQDKAEALIQELLDRQVIMEDELAEGRNDLLACSAKLSHGTEELAYTEEARVWAASHSDQYQRAKKAEAALDEATQPGRHCDDCCCEDCCCTQSWQSWDALGVSEFDGRSMKVAASYRTLSLVMDGGGYADGHCVSSGKDCPQAEEEQ